MKQLKSIFLACLGLCLMTGCTDFLDSAPVTLSVESDFYKTEKDAYLALIGCYDGVQSMWSDGFAVPVASIIMSDECFGGTGTGDGRGYPMVDEFKPDLSRTDVNLYNMNWVLYYKAIYRCNMLLKFIDRINWVTPGYKEQVEAEAKYLRAFIYFEMVKLWGHIPLVTTPLAVKDCNVPQSDPADVYTLIANDLVFASENAQLKGTVWTQDWANVNDGRVTVFAAKALLARVFLYYTGYYNQSELPNGTNKDQVITALTDVYNSGQGLVTNFNDLWPAACSKRDVTALPIGLSTTYAGEGNKETVWAIKFNSSGTWQGNTDGFIPMKMMGMRNGTIKSYGASVYGDGAWGGATVSDGFVKNWDTSEPNDPRRIASIIDINKEGMSMSLKHDQDEYTGYFNKKFTCLGNGSNHIYTTQSLDFQINEYQDYTVIRYADVLLMLSELTGEVQYMNEVRRRVHLTEKSLYNLEELRTERAHELAFEGVRYWDLLRYGLDYAANAITYNGFVLVGYKDVKPGTVKTIDGNKVKTCFGLSQIPNKQITLSNNTLVQNIGWRAND